MISICRNTLFLIFLIAAGIDYTVPWPIYNTEENSPSISFKTRFARQVVQPKWLNFGHEPPIDPIVHVNPQVLMEAEQIRKAIQQAVKENTYVVTGEGEMDQNIMGISSTEAPHKESNVRHRIHSTPNWFALLLKLWKNFVRKFLHDIITK